MRTMGAAKAKAQFLAILDEVQAKREPVLVTKNGKPVAQLVPLDEAPDADPLAIFKIGGVEIIGDLFSPVNDLDDWEYD